MNVIEIAWEERGWNQAELARRMGVDRSYISNLKKDTNTMGINKAQEFADLLEVDIARLFRRRD